MLQFALISLIPGLLRKLEDCADPDLDNYEKRLVMPTSLRTSDRKSCRVETSMATLVANMTSTYIYGIAIATLWQRGALRPLYSAAAARCAR